MVESILPKLHQHDVILFAVKVLKNQGYNKLDISSGKYLLGIDKYPTEESYLTYTGVSLVNGETIEEGKEKVGFFESIADPKKKRVKVVCIPNNMYYDFGTLKLYFKQIIDIFDHIQGKGKPSSENLFYFLKEMGAINTRKINEEEKASHRIGKSCHYFGELCISLEEERCSVEFDGLVSTIGRREIRDYQ